MIIQWKMFTHSLPMLLVLLLIPLSAVQSAIPAEFQFSAQPDGGWSIAVDGDIWFKSGPTWFNANNKTFSTEDKTLQLKKTRTDAGKDNIGRWKRTFFTFECTVTNASFETQIVTYVDYAVVLWGQNYLKDTSGTSSGSRERTVSGYPTFDLKANTTELYYWAAKGYMAGYYDMSHGRWTNETIDLSHGDTVGPISIFPGSRSGRGVIISPFSEFMSWSLNHDKNASQLNFGMLGLAESIPAGFLPFQMLYYSNNGINKMFREWGDLLQTYWNTHNSDYRESDFTADYLGYWTDGGACYYYWTETGLSYEQTLNDVKLYADQMKIPYQYMQFDSWWYPKDKQSGMLEWVPMPEVFPNGIQWFVNKTGLPASAHIKWWSPHTPLAKQNGGKYDFIIEEKMALPVDPKLYDDVLNAGRKWGVRTLEEDWFGQMWDALHCLQSNVTLGSTWMLYMYEGVRRNGMTLQQCTSYPRHVYMGLQMPVVTQQRVSADYRPGSKQWQIGMTSLWVNALGQRPFKDTFWSTDIPQYCSNIYRGFIETAPTRQAIVATLSTGPVAPSDRIGDSNRQLLMKSCRTDGLILSPDQAATAIDDQFYEAAIGDKRGPLGEVWSTFSNISGHLYGIVFVADLKADFKITPSLAGFTLADESIIFTDKSPSKYEAFSSSHPYVLPASTSDAQLYYVSPVFSVGQHKVAVLGDLTKFVPMSSVRFYQLDVADDDVLVEMTGAAQEKVSVWYLIDGKLGMSVCNMDRFQRVVLSVMTQQCGRG